MRSIVETELVALSIGGDGRAFEQLVSPYLLRLRRHVRGLVGHDGDSEDVLQEALLLAWKGLGTFRGDSGVYTWLYSIAHNCALSFLKRSRRRFPAPADWRGDAHPDDRERDPAHGDSPDALMEAADALDLLDARLGRLPPGCREVFLACVVHGRRYEDAASAFAIPVGTVRSRVHRAREELGLLLTR